MPKVLIADVIKPSLVMSSEIFKDKIPGAEIIVATTGANAIELAELERPDICLIDFDLPDVDGPSLILALRKVYSGPILMSAYPDNNVKEAVQQELFAYNDASAWLSKPIKFEDLATQIDKFLIDHHRTGKRFTTDLPMQIIAKAAGRGKRAPKSMGKVLNISLGGACIQLDQGLKVKKKQEITVAIAFPSAAKPAAATTKATKAAAQKSRTLKDSDTTKFKARIAWLAKDGQIGVQFSKLTDVQIKGLESYLRTEV